MDELENPERLFTPFDMFKLERARNIYNTGYV